MSVREVKRKMSDPEGFREIGRTHVVTMQHVDQAETETVTKVGVNEEPQFRAAEVSQKVAGVIVKVMIKEDNRVKGGTGNIQFASKKVRQIEIDEELGAGTAPVGSPTFTKEYREPASTSQAQGAEAKDEGKSFLKNMIDNIENRLGAEIPRLHGADKSNFKLVGLSLGLVIGSIIIGVMALIH